MNLKNILLTFTALVSLNITSNIKSAVEDISNLKDFNEKVLTENAAVVKFYAPWCGPCKRMISVVESIEKEYAGKLKVFEVNADTAMAVAEKYEVSSIPQLLFISNGTIKGKMFGYASAHSVKLKIKEYLNI